jgi:succinate dehydrogenase hydrophobic anchor subunit
MYLKKVLLIVGIILMLCWLWLFGASTVKLISQVLNDEPYYFDNTFIYFFVYALAPFIAYEYLRGVEDVVDSYLHKAKQKFLLFLLIAFALMQLLFAFGFTYIFFDSSISKVMSLEVLWLLLPTSFFVLFVYTSRFLYRTTLKK